MKMALLVSLKYGGLSAADWISVKKSRDLRVRYGSIIFFEPASICLPQVKEMNMVQKKQKQTKDGVYGEVTNNMNWDKTSCSAIYLARWTEALHKSKPSMTDMYAPQY